MLAETSKINETNFIIQFYWETNPCNQHNKKQTKLRLNKHIDKFLVGFTVIEIQEWLVINEMN